MRLGPLTVAYAPPYKRALVEALLHAGTGLIAQSGGDLGERMFAAAADLFSEGDEPVLILGTDAPTLPKQNIARAAQSLGGEDPHDIAIVASKDGGYVLLGLGEPYKELFRGIEWSTASVREETLTKARALGLSVYEGEPYYDVDTPEDLDRLRRELERDPRLAPHTAKLLMGF